METQFSIYIFGEEAIIIRSIFVILHSLFPAAPREEEMEDVDRYAGYAGSTAMSVFVAQQLLGLPPLPGEQRRRVDLHLDNN